MTGVSLHCDLCPLGLIGELLFSFPSVLICPPVSSCTITVTKRWGRMWNASPWIFSTVIREAFQSKKWGNLGFSPKWRWPQAPHHPLPPSGVGPFLNFGLFWSGMSPQKFFDKTSWIWKILVQNQSIWEREREIYLGDIMNNNSPLTTFLD